MSAAALVLPLVWAYGAPVEPGERKGPVHLTVVEGGGLSLAGHGLRQLAEDAPQRGIRAVPGRSPQGDVPDTRDVPKGMAFYRKYTEGMLRRYVRLSMEAGRTPSLLGRELFRGSVTNYKVQSFEDVVIFVHDVGQCLAKLDSGQQYILRRIGQQEYTQGEMAEMSGTSIRTVHRRYLDALDRLTELFIAGRMMDPFKSCQGGKTKNSL